MVKKTPIYYNCKNIVQNTYNSSFINLRSALAELNNVSYQSKLSKILKIRGGKYEKTYSPGTQIITEEEYINSYKEEINLDELDNINRLNRAYTKPKEKFISGNRSGRSLKDKPVTLPTNHENTVAKEPNIENPKVEKPYIENPKIEKPFVENPKVEKPYAVKPINNKPTVDIKDDDYGNTRRILDERKKEFEKMKDEFIRNGKRKIASKPSVPVIPLSLTYKEMFEAFILKNNLIFNFISHSLNFAILYFYIRTFKAIIIEEYKRISIYYKNKEYKSCINPLFKLLLHLLFLATVLTYGSRTIKFISLKLFYYVYVSIVFLKEKNFLMNKISNITNNIIYSFEWLINLYLVLFKDLFKYINGLGEHSIDSSLDYLLHNRIGQTISNPLLTKVLIKLRSYFIKGPVEALACKVMDSAFNTSFAHKAEFQALFKMNRVFEEYKTYCFNNNKKDIMIDYLTNNKIKLRLMSPSLIDYKSDTEYFIKFNKLLCELYNIKKNYAKSLTSKFIIFSNYKNFKPGTFLDKLFDDVAKFNFDDEIVRKESIKFIDKLVYEDTIQGTLPEWIYSSILIANAYKFDILELKKLFSINTPAYVVNDKNFCRYLNFREIIYKVFYKNFYKLFLYTGLIFSSCIFFSYLKQIIPQEIKKKFFKKIESIKKYLSEFFEEIPAITIVLLLCLNLLYIQYLKYILFIL